MTKYLTIDQIIEFHETLVEEFGGLHGIRDKNLLHSAIDVPRATFGG